MRSLEPEVMHEREAVGRRTCTQTRARRSMESSPSEARRVPRRSGGNQEADRGLTDRALSCAPPVDGDDTPGGRPPDGPPHRPPAGWSCWQTPKRRRVSCSALLGSAGFLPKIPPACDLKLTPACYRPTNDPPAARPLASHGSDRPCWGNAPSFASRPSASARFRSAPPARAGRVLAQRRRPLPGCSFGNETRREPERLDATDRVQPECDVGAGEAVDRRRKREEEIQSGCLTDRH
jgi:hypothetical protein